MAKKPSPAVSTSLPRKRPSWGANRLVVLLQQLAPGAVAELCGPRRCADDVGEEDGGEHTVRLGLARRTFVDFGEKPLELRKEPVLVPDQGTEVPAR